mmetsp:Transcript_119617/g.339126  ORF Transcript_119617/g.339126 Transcript_119617/m.339126 type:complete len:254 (-) Transcript_119617:67-828(-)
MVPAQGDQAPPCVMCLKPATKQCSGCHAFWYCSKECQRKHWRTHKMDCGRTKELQEMTPKKLLQELEDREREFHVVTELVKKHRDSATNKNVWVTRNDSMLREDLEDARLLPTIKGQLEEMEKNPGQHQQAVISTLFSAAEGVSRAKTLAYFEEVKDMKEQLKEMAKEDEKAGTTTLIKCGGQQGWDWGGRDSQGDQQEGGGASEAAEQAESESQGGGGAMAGPGHAEPGPGAKAAAAEETARSIAEATSELD